MNEEKKVPFKWEYGEETISLQLGMYANNQRLYIGMITHTEDGAEPFADMTVNLSWYSLDPGEAFISGDISKDVLLRISASELFDFLKSWAEEFKPEIMHMFDDRAYLEKILDIGRDGSKPRKDHIYAQQMVENISYFFDDMFKIEDSFPAEVEAAGDTAVILKKYLETYDHSDDQETWFNKIRAITEELGYAVKPKDFKKNPDQYKGHVGHVSTVIRVALMGRQQSPDVWEIQQILGEARTRERLQRFI